MAESAREKNYAAGIPAATIMEVFSLNERAGPGKNRAGVPPGMAQIFRFCAKVAGARDAAGMLILNAIKNRFCDKSG